MCEAAGFDVVLVETVGVGQSEVAVAGMVDLFVLLLAPGAGDELQGVKRGIVELADLLVVNKADGDLADLARHTAADYGHALHLVRANDDGAIDRVRTCSALLGEGIDELWEVVGDLVAAARASGELDAAPFDPGPRVDVVGGHRHPARRAAGGSRGQGPNRVARGRCHERPGVAGRGRAAGAGRVPLAVSRAFSELTPTGQIRRLRALAAEALREYDLGVRRISFAAQAFNTVFRVDAADGSAYALRVSPELRIHTDGCEALEAAWIEALRRDIGFATPAVIRTRDASADAWVRTDGVPEARSCVLFEWVVGGRLRDRMSAEAVRRVGELTAILHDQGGSHASADASAVRSHASADAPVGALVADHVLYFRAENRLDELRPTYGSVLREGLDRAQRALDALWRSPPHSPHLLHGDVQPGNVMVSRGKVTLIDFQDLIWGFEIQDVVFALLAFDRFEEAPAYKDAFRSGYEAVRRWPDVDPETNAALRAARDLNVLNFGLNLRKPGFETNVTRHAGRVADWMSRTG